MSLNNNLYREILSPLDQFEIRDLISLDAPIFGYLHISITNIGLYLTIAAIFLFIINILSTNYNKLVSNNWSISQESLYATIHSIVINQINGKTGQNYFPFIYTLFIVILVNNLVGMVKRSLYILYLIILYSDTQNLKSFTLYPSRGIMEGWIDIIIIITIAIGVIIQRKTIESILLYINFLCIIKRILIQTIFLLII